MAEQSPGCMFLSGVGPVQPLLPHPLHHEVVGHTADPAPVPHVQAGVEVQRVISLKLGSHQDFSGSDF